MILPSTRLFREADADPKILKDLTIAVLGYGNQGRAQALNLRDRDLQVLVGNRSDSYRQRAEADGFETFEIAAAVKKAQIHLLLLPDEELPSIYADHIQPNLKKGDALVFASGYVLAFDQIDILGEVDILLLAPRMIGVGVRERYLTGESFYCLIGVHQDYSGVAQKKLLALTRAIGGLGKPAIEVTCRQEAVLDLFNEQAFGPAFGRVLLTAIQVLLDQGLPPEAVLVEMYLSEEMSYTYKKMAEIGLVKQTHFHSHTSQYGALSRGARFLGMDLRRRMETIYQDIDCGDFAREWGGVLGKMKFRILKFFAFRQRINEVEEQVRQVLGLDRIAIPAEPVSLEDEAEKSTSREEWEQFQQTFEF